MRGDKVGIGRVLYFEWLFPVKDYYITTSKNEIVFEIITPLAVGIVIALASVCLDVLEDATEELSEVLITLLSMMIGFSIMLITLLLTSGGDGIDSLKTKMIENVRIKAPISLFQKLHIQFCYCLISEIFLLIFVLVYKFVALIQEKTGILIFFLVVFVAMTLNILLSIVRGITNVYFVYYAADNRK